MALRILILLLPLVIILPSCLTAKKWDEDANLKPLTVYRPDAQSGPYKTYRWFSEPTSNPVSGPGADLNGPFQIIQTTVESDLAARGYTKTSSGNPSFWVGFFVAIRGQEGAVTIDQYGGLDAFPDRSSAGRDAAEILGTTLYEVANLVVEIVDGQNHQTVLQSRVTTEIDRSRPAEETQQRITTAVNNMLADFPAAQ
ncbi:MAG: DUF4136 domain-containing protein [Verrucomicrobiota bacterium]